MKFHIHKLELVYPPISNQEAEWLKNEKDVQNEIKASNLYMIGQKPESFFVPHFSSHIFARPSLDLPSPRKSKVF